MHLLYSIYFIVILVFGIFQPTQYLVSANEYYYEAESPYRASLQEQYVDESDEEYYIKPKTVSSLRTNYLKRKNKINSDMKNAKKEQELKSALATTADVIGEPIKTEEQQMVKEVFNREVVSQDEEGERIRVINTINLNNDDELGGSYGKGQPLKTETVVLLKKRKKSSQTTEKVLNVNNNNVSQTQTTASQTTTEQSQKEENVSKTDSNPSQSPASEKQPSKRDLMLQSKGVPKQDAEETSTEKKTKTSWLDSWLVYKDVKPMDYIGAYSIFKLLFTWPAGMKFSSNETRTIGEKKTSAELFNGTADMGFMPAFFISAGNDRFKFWRWEVELGYIPLRVSKIKSLEMNTVDNPGSSFIVSKKNLGTHFINLNFNNYVQFAFFDKSIVAFLGIGLGIGYAWSFDKSRLSSNFVLPVVSAYFGITFMISKTRKMNISYRLSYADFSINNKYAWPDGNKVLFDGRPIIGGKTHFKDLFISAISIEYMFYVN